MYPRLIYGSEAFMLNKSELSSLDFVINRLFMKLFRKTILKRLNFVKISLDLIILVMWARRVRNFDSKFVASENAFCKLTLSL